MTETEWLDASNPSGKLDDLKADSDRKLRLFACACARRVWHLLIDERSRNAVEAAEMFADTAAWAAARDAAWAATWDAAWAAAEAAAEAAAWAAAEPPPPAAWDAAWAAARAAAWAATWDAAWAATWDAAWAAAWAAAEAPPPATWAAAWAATWDAAEAAAEAAAWAAAANIIRDVFNNPFRPVAFDSRFRTSLVLSLAQAAYDDRPTEDGALDHVRLLVLADALEEAGAHDAILEHLRSPGPHVRGCWALDSILGKK